MRLYSLRRATLSALLLPLFLSILVVAFVSSQLTTRATAALLDEQLQQEANFLLLLIQHEAIEGEEIGISQTIESGEFNKIFLAGTFFRIWSNDVIVTQSAGMHNRTTPPPLGFGHRAYKGSNWRTFALRAHDAPTIIEIEQSPSVQGAFVHQILYSLLLPGIFLITAVCGVAYIQVTAAMRPLRRISADIDRRQADDLSSISGYSIPFEIAPLFTALNQLLVRLRNTVEHEREFADNAAHELRTPLAALKTRAQVIERQLAGDPARQKMLAQLVAATNRATGVIDQLLVLDRVPQLSNTDEVVDISVLVADRSRELGALALLKNQQLLAEIAPGVLVLGQVEALGMIIGNLIDNAIRYTQDAGEIRIDLSKDSNNRAVFTVVDNGPGVPEAQHHAILQRFYRIGHGQAGSGLGLTIVHRLVTQLNGSMRIENRQPHGLKVEISLVLNV